MLSRLSRATGFLADSAARLIDPKASIVSMRGTVRHCTVIPERNPKLLGAVTNALGENHSIDKPTRYGRRLEEITRESEAFFKEKAGWPPEFLAALAEHA